MKTELVFIPLPAISHLVSTVQFAKLLVGRDEELSIKILTFKVPFDANANTYMESLHAAESIRGVQYVQLPDSPLAIDSEGNPQNPFHFMSRLIDSQKPQVRKVVSRSSRLAGVVVDMFCTPMIDVANEFDMPTYVFYTSGAAVIGIRHHIQSLIDDKFDINQVKDSDFEFSVSTYINPVPAKLCPSPMLDDSGLILYHTRRLVNESKGIIVNTFLELESYAIQGLISNKKMPKIYPIGPLINSDSKTNNQDSDIILRWLDDQPISSVVFLCFGSYGSFEGEQVKEIASALEQSGCRFLWSLRRPPLNEPSAEYPGEYQYHKEVLPEGFLERTSTVGKVIGWAPQTRVLAHPAVGGFVTHCGWNSVLESVWFGVPMAAWPMYAEQQLNALFLVKDLGIASEIKLDYKLDIMSRSAQVIVRADEIESGIRNLMQPGMKVKAKELMEKARTSLQEGGSSNISLGRLIEDFHGSDEGGH